MTRSIIFRTEISCASLERRIGNEERNLDSYRLTWINAKTGSAQICLYTLGSRQPVGTNVAHWVTVGVVGWKNILRGNTKWHPSKNGKLNATIVRLKPQTMRLSLGKLVLEVAINKRLLFTVDSTRQFFLFLYQLTVRISPGNQIFQTKIPHLHLLLFKPTYLTWLLYS